MGIELLTEEQYRTLQQLGEFDSETSSWIAAPADVRALGRGLFCDRRFGRVFTGHGSAFARSPITTECSRITRGFKRNRGSRFATLDSYLFSPICLLLAACGGCRGGRSPERKLAGMSTRGFRRIHVTAILINLTQLALVVWIPIAISMHMR